MSDTLDDFTPQVRNANRHTEHGMRKLETSIRENGWIGGITVAADGEIFDGSARREVLESTLDTNPIVVDSDGTRPIIIRRMDIPTATDPRAVRLGIAANKIAHDNLQWDISVLSELAEDGDMLDGLFSDQELDYLLVDDPNDAANLLALDDEPTVTCPDCGCKFTPD